MLDDDVLGAPPSSDVDRRSQAQDNVDRAFPVYWARALVDSQRRPGGS